MTVVLSKNLQRVSPGLHVSFLGNVGLDRFSLLSLVFRKLVDELHEPINLFIRRLRANDDLDLLLKINLRHDVVLLEAVYLEQLPYVQAVLNDEVSD
jgi:hypothetical protein